MKPSPSATSALDASYKAVAEVPFGFDFFVAIHDLVKKVESHPSFSHITMPPKYTHFRQIYQGIEDLRNPSLADIGHERNMIVQDLLRIRDHHTMTDGNPVWRKRELLRRFAGDIHKLLVTPAETTEKKA